MILGYVKCTSPGCDAAMEVSQCSGKRSKYLKGRCHTCECTEQRSNANTQNYLQAYKPFEELNQVVEPEEVPPEDTSGTLEMPQEPQSPAPNSKGSGWLCPGIGAAIGLGMGKAIKQNEIDAKQMALEATQEGVLVGMGIVDTMVKEFIDPRMEIDESNAVAISQAAAPVILKYNVSPPPWAVKYKEEIALGVAVLGLSASLFMQHRQLKKLDLEAKRGELERAQQEQSDATQH